MSKIYSFGDVVKAYEGGYEGDFVKVGDENFRIRFGKSITYTADNVAEEWVKADRKVDFITAIKELSDNNATIYCITESGIKFIYKPNDISYKITDQNNNAVGTEEILHGEWFIKYNDEE